MSCPKVGANLNSDKFAKDRTVHLSVNTSVEYTYHYVRGRFNFTFKKFKGSPTVDFQQ